MDGTQPRRIAEGRQAEILLRGDGRIIKLYRRASGQREAEVEQAAMTAAKAAGGPAPGAYGIEQVDGRPALIMERIEGIDLLTRLGTKPWTIFGAASMMGRAHAALHAIAGPPELRPAKEALREAIETSDRVPATVRTRALAALDGLPQGDRLCHGDFHPGNIMLTSGGPVVIDWPNALRGDPAADIARTRLMIEMGELPPGAPALLRALDRVGRKVLLWRYPAAYRRLRPIDEAAVRSWHLPVAAHRLTEGIEEERENLLRLVDDDT